MNLSRLAQKALAASLAAAVLVAAPGPTCYDALAAEVVGGRAATRGATVGLPAMAIAPAAGLSEQPALGDLSAPALLAPALTAPAAVDQAPLGTAPLEAAAPAALEQGAALAAQAPAAAPSLQVQQDLQASPRAAARPEAFAALSEMGKELSQSQAAPAAAGRSVDLGRARFDGASALQAANDSGEPVAAAAPGAAAPGLAPAARPQYNGGPAGPTQPYTLGKIGTIRHGIAQWFLKKLDLYEGLYNFTAWFGDWSRYLAIWPLYSQVLHMRLHNMYTTRHLTNEAPPPAWSDKKNDKQMSPDGAHTDLKDGNVGRAGIAMSHNMPLEMIQPKVVDTPLLKVSQEFMPRRTFRFVPSVNSHFAAEIQFQIEGWFGSLFSKTKKMMIKVPKTYLWSSPVMEVAATQEAPNKKAGVAMPVYNNVEASAWDLNPVYGSTEEQMLKLRTNDGKGAKLKVGEDGLLPLDPAYPAENGGGVDLTGSPRNIWAVRSIRHLAFVLEHNDIVDEYRAYLKNGPAKDTSWLAFLDRGYRRDLWLAEKAQFEAMTTEEQDDWLYWRARTITSGENAGDHTHDWTEMLLPGAVTKLGMEIDYFGLLGRNFKKWWYPKMWMHRAFGWLLKKDILSGLPGSPVQRWSAPYDLGQTFLKVYRMRELMRDSYRVWALESGQKRADIRLKDMQGVHTRRALAAHPVVDWIYSAGLQHPGDLLLNNVTTELQHLSTMDGREVDMTLMDLLRDDERGFPRYNAYRRALHLPYPRSMLELTGGDWELAQRLDKFYRRYLKEMHVKGEHVRRHRMELAARFKALYAEQHKVDVSAAPEPNEQELFLLSPEPTEQEVAAAPEPTDLEVVESVHAHVGLRASPRMPGMVLSVDAYIIFTLNAPDRFAANRFLSEQFNFETYGEVGINRVMNFDFKTLLLRHWPQLELALDGKASGYAPFNRLHPQLDPKIDAEEKANGIVTHSLDSIAGMGPRALNALYANSEVGAIPDGVSEGRAIVLQGTWLGGILSKLANLLWKGKVFDAAAGALNNRILGMKIVPAKVAQGESWSDAKPSIIIDYSRTSWWWLPARLIRDEIRQVGPTTYLGKAYVGFWGLKLFGLHFALDFAPAAQKPTPGYQELSDEVERSALKLIKHAFLLTAWTLPVLALGAGLFAAWTPLLLLAASLGLQFAALLAHNVGRQTWKRALAETGMGELGALQGLRYLNRDAGHADGLGGKLSLLAAAAGLAAMGLALHAILPAALAVQAAFLALGAAYAMTALARRLVLGKNMELLRVSLYSIIKQGRPRRDAGSLPGDSDLEKHARFFSEGKPVGTLWTMFRQVKKLGIPGFMTALSSALLFSGKTQAALSPAQKGLLGRFDVYMPNIVAAQHPAHSGVYGPDGNVNDAQFERIFAEFAPGRDYVTAQDIARMRRANYERARANGVSFLKALFSYFASKRQFDQLLMVAPDRVAWEDGKWVPAISRAQLRYWYEGGLRYDIAQEHESYRP
ncbi:MAG TPA: caleosin family protein [Elusimicrobiota bacterium]|nr:caleosin family protein [Elusimicrobiota bacterium]